jgi:biotin synthase-like enzyme
MAETGICVHYYKTNCRFCNQSSSDFIYCHWFTSLKEISNAARKARMGHCCWMYLCWWKFNCIIDYF